jgi:hypothetical protein
VIGLGSVLRVTAVSTPWELPDDSVEATKLSNVYSRVVNPAPDLRPAAPAEVWDYRAYSSWRDEIWTLVSDFADSKVRAAFVAAPPEYVVSDDLSWLDNIVFNVHGSEIDSKSRLAGRLRPRFRAMRAVHGTRTANVESFYLNGVRPLVPEEFHKEAHEIFLSGAFSELSEPDVQAAIDKVGISVREGLAYFEANEEMLKELAGHHMLYGSEYLTAIAANIGHARDYRQVLKKQVGLPTIFVCDVPLNLIDHGTLLEFSGTALENIFLELLEGEDFQPDRWRGAGFCIRTVLAPEHLVGHYHPVGVRDPLVR